MSLTEFDFFKTTNNAISGIVLYIGRLVFTSYRLLLAPMSTSQDLINEEKQGVYTLPFNYLITTYIIFVASLNKFIPPIWVQLYKSFVDDDLKRFWVLLEEIKKKEVGQSLFSFSEIDIISYVIPYVLALSGISYILAFLFGLKKGKRVIAIHLSCYASGVTLIITTIVFILRYWFHKIGLSLSGEYISIIRFSFFSFLFTVTGIKVYLPLLAIKDKYYRIPDIFRRIFLSWLFYFTTFVLSGWIAWQINSLEL